MEENYYYVDKTMYIQRLEEVGSYLFCIRPRRFGKSVFIDMLSAYYDISKKDRFMELFGKLWIGNNPTLNATKYQVLKFDFSRATAPLAELPGRFSDYCNQELDNFIEKYQEYYSEEFIKSFKEADTRLKLDKLKGASERLGYKYYLFVDEYDNFTNVILSNEGKETFHALTHADGFYRDFFKLFKGMFDRIFMFGVSPITMDDLTSGYNIDLNISLDEEFNSMLGFCEYELREMLTYYKDQGRITREINDILGEMRYWYNNYCFSKKCCGNSTVYNSTMTLYYVNSLVYRGSAPEEMVDKNTRTDYNKLTQLVNIDRGIDREKRTRAVMDIANTGWVDMRLVSSFPAMNISDLSNFLSLLYYYGMITMDRVIGSRIHMIIPNQSVKLLYWDYIVRIYQSHHKIELSGLLDDFDKMAFVGNWKPLMLRLGDEYYKASSVRDAIEGEHNVQGFIKAYLSMCDYHIFCPELEMGYGYSDFFMMADGYRYPDVHHSYIIEIKYAKPSESDGAVRRLSVEADDQLRKYASDSAVKRLTAATNLHLIKLVFHGPNLLICDSLSE